MKTIGILGGMSAASTQIYFQELCRLAQERLGGLHSPELLIRSVDFAPIAALQEAGNWTQAATHLHAEAKALERGGAELIILATNTMHKLSDAIFADISVPFLHIADATASAISAAGYKRPGLMATRFTMEQAFYTDRLCAAQLSPIIPEAEDRTLTHRIIYEELCRHIVTDDSRQTYVEIAQRLVNRGADCLILGCTEVGMLLSETNVTVPVFDTTLIHCSAALEQALK